MAVTVTSAGIMLSIISLTAMNNTEYVVMQWLNATYMRRNGSPLTGTQVRLAWAAAVASYFVG